MPDLGSGAARRVGSSPIIRTEKSFWEIRSFLFLGHLSFRGTKESHALSTHCCRILDAIPSFLGMTSNFQNHVQITTTIIMDIISITMWLCWSFDLSLLHQWQTLPINDVCFPQLLHFIFAMVLINNPKLIYSDDFVLRFSISFKARSLHIQIRI